VPIARKVTTTRSALIDAAVTCLVEGGYRHTTTMAVCERAGVTSGALFGQFRNKGALLAAAEDSLVARSHAEIAAALQELEGHRSESWAGDPAEAIRTVAEELVTVYRRPTPAATAELRIAARRDPRLAKVMRDSAAATAKLIEETFCRMAPEMGPDPTLAAVARLVHSVAWSRAEWTISADGLLADSAATAGGIATDRVFDQAVSILASRYREDLQPARPAGNIARTLVRTLLARAGAPARMPIAASS
jgi:AcrR family transcriptional regulator